MLRLLILLILPIQTFAQHDNNKLYIHIVSSKYLIETTLFDLEPYVDECCREAYDSLASIKRDSIHVWTFYSNQELFFAKEPIVINQRIETGEILVMNMDWIYSMPIDGRDLRVFKKTPKGLKSVQVNTKYRTIRRFDSSKLQYKVPNGFKRRLSFSYIIRKPRPSNVKF
jgi:hypothetical protein